MDSFNHVNNSVYLNYLEEGRWRFLKELGILNYLIDSSLMLIVTELSIRYIKEARVFDELEVETKFIDFSGPFLNFQQIVKNMDIKRVITKAKVTTLLVDRDRIPHDCPSEVAKILTGSGQY